MNEANLIEAKRRIDEVRKNELRYLDLSFLALDKIPEDISNMRFLLDIDLSYNRFKEFPKALTQLTNVRILDLSNNCLRELEFDESKYYSIVEIDISNNAFNFIPDSLFSFHGEVEIRFEGNPFLEGLPPEFEYSDDLDYIRYYLSSLRSETTGSKLFETKLLLVGKGEVGKTTLMKVIQNPRLKVAPGKEKTTHGIDVTTSIMEVAFPARPPYYSQFTDFNDLYINPHDLDEDDFEHGFIKMSDFLGEIEAVYFEDDIIEWRKTDSPFNDLPCENYIKKEIKINMWDFGGQEILYSTHQFFLTQRSIYLFVWEPRSDKEEESFDYWLNTIDRLGKGSPVIVVMNKADVRIKSIDEKAYHRKFENIRKFLQVSCLTKEGIPNLIEEIKDCIGLIPHIGDQMPTTWENVRKSLKQVKADYIDFDAFKTICNTDEEKKALHLSRYLCDLGDIIYFEDDFNLQNLVVINPEWLTKAIYELIHSLEIQKNKGVFNRNELSILLNKKKYPKAKHVEILRLMERFEICFKIIGERDLYIIPALLQASPKDDNLVESFLVPEALKYEVEYKYMPSGIIERLICKLNNYLKEDVFWKYGAVFNSEHGEAIVFADKLDKKISIFAKGNMPTEIFNVVRYELKEVNSQLKLSDSDFKEKIACNCSECSVSGKTHMFDIQVLNKYLDKSKEKIDCQQSVEEVDIKELLIGYKPSKKSKSLVRDFVQAFSILQSRHKLVEGFSEDKINTYFQDLLRPFLADKGFYTNEQSFRGSSQSKKQAGELDINIETIKGNSVSFYEGFILNSLKKTTVDDHLEKTLLNYDSNGLKEKFVGVYCRANNFSSLVEKYENYVESFKLREITFIKNEDLSKIYVNGSEIKLFRSIYERNKTRLHVFHILVNLKN